MNLKKIVKILLLILASVIFIYGCNNIIKYLVKDDVYTTRYVSGKVLDKFESAYSCGKHSVCYVRYLKVENVTQSVILDTYVRTRIGDNVNLVVKEKQGLPSTPLDILSTLFSLLVVGCASIMLLISFILWLWED